MRSEIPKRLILIDRRIFKTDLQTDSHRDPCHHHHTADMAEVLLEKDRSSEYLWSQAEGTSGVIRILH